MVGQTVRTGWRRGTQGLRGKEYERRVITRIYLRKGCGEGLNIQKLRPLPFSL